MSGAYVREQLRAQVAALVPAGFAYFESINLATSTKDLPGRWYTLDFPPANVEPQSLGRPTLNREAGTPLVQFYSEQQIGDGPAVSAAEVVRAGLVHWRDATGHLRITSVGPPNDMDGGDFRGSFYCMGLDVLYTFDRLE